MSRSNIQSSATVSQARTLCALLVFVLITLPLNAQQSSGDAALVQQFFPASLIAESTADFNLGGPPPFQASAFAEADLNGTGTKNFIVAAYTNGFSAIVRVLQKQGSSAILANEPQVPLMGGINPTVTLIDLDNDGRPEVVVGLSSARGAIADWIFHWNGSALHLIGPTSTGPGGNPTTLLGDADFINLNGNGVLAIVNPPDFDSTSPGSNTPLTATVFTLSNGVYVPANINFDFFQTYLRSAGPPVDSTSTFTASNPGSAYAVRIINGDTTGANRVSSATVTLNGTVVVGPSAFNQNVTTVTVPVTINQSNTLTVRLASAPGAQLTIGIGPQ